MSNLILELYSEELPVNAQEIAIQSCPIVFKEKLASLCFSKLEVLTSPCRVSIALLNMKEETSLPGKLLKGPRLTANEAAIEGFCRQTAVEREKLEEKDGYYHVALPPATVKTSDILKEALPCAIGAIPWEKSMRWDASRCIWPRPLRNILCMLDSEVVEFSFYNLVANNITFGHKFLSGSFCPKPIRVGAFEDYIPLLESNLVIPVPAKRRELIEEQAYSILAENDLQQVLDQELLNEVVGLVEMPCVGLGRIPQQYMAIPSELIATVIKVHQKYFATYYADGSIAPYFLFVANKKDLATAQVSSGNERVLAARLSDACFLYQKDMSISMDSRMEKLEAICFQEKLGSMRQKAFRLEKMCASLNLNNQEKLSLELAARICKCDLAGDLVPDFPTLAGIVSSYYAAGLDEAVALAVKFHNAPIAQEDSLPPTPLGCYLSLLDKVDSLVGLYIAGKRSTGNKDPYGLRRLAFGIIRILVSGGRFGDIELQALLELSASLYSSAPEGLVKELDSFIRMRHESMLSERFAHPLVRSVVWSAKYKPALAEGQIQGICEFALDTSFPQVCIAFKRANNLLLANASLVGDGFKPTNLLDEMVSSESLAQPEAKLLMEALAEYDAALEGGFSFKGLARLVSPLNAFLDELMVSGDLARLALIGAVLERFNASFDFQSVASFLSNSH